MSGNQHIIVDSIKYYYNNEPTSNITQHIDNIISSEKFSSNILDIGYKMAFYYTI
jgi:hypothetical protein